jgi:hypothetical protein
MGGRRDNGTSHLAWLPPEEEKMCKLRSEQKLLFFETMAVIHHIVKPVRVSVLEGNRLEVVWNEREEA